MKTVKMQVLGTLAIFFVFHQLNLAMATPVQITVATYKQVYLLTETPILSVTATNTNNYVVDLAFTCGFQADYLIDSGCRWSKDMVAKDMLTGVNIPPFCSYTWELQHYSATDIGIGIHSVVGQVISYGESQPLEFSVVPEPTTILLLLALGSLALRKHRT